MLSEKEKNALHKKWDEFEKNQPEIIRIGKAGLNGEDLILRKTTIKGIPVYTAPFDTSSWFNFLKLKRRRSIFATK